MFNVQRPSTIVMDACRITRSGTKDYTAALFTLADTSHPCALLVRGGAIRASDPFWTYPGADSWQVSVQSVGKLSDPADAPLQMKWRLGPLTAVKSFTGLASFTPNTSAASIFKFIASDAIPAVTINVPTGAAIGQRITFDLINGRASAPAVYDFASGAGGFVKAGDFVSPAAGGRRRLIDFYFDGAAWIESSRSATDVG